MSSPSMSVSDLGPIGDEGRSLFLLLWLEPMSVVEDASEEMLIRGANDLCGEVERKVGKAFSW